MTAKINDGLTKEQRYRLRHPESAERDKKWHLEHPEVWKVHALIGNKTSPNHYIPIAEWCELCPEDDVRKATQRHHPDYDYPKIFVSCCASCHHYQNRGVS